VLDRELPAVLAGEAEPADAARLLQLARFATHRKREFVKVAALFDRCFTRHPDWATGRPGHWPRYYAAVTAAMAARGEGLGVDRLDEGERRRLREQARLWLRAELVTWEAVRQRGDPAGLQMLREQVRFWQRDGWASSVRDRAALDRLAPDERLAWQRLWSDVDDLLRRAGPPIK
jgi:hypothetical protein